FNPYLNFHRPCGFATVRMDGRGKRQRIYKAADYATPYEKLKSLPDAAQYLKVPERRDPLRANGPNRRLAERYPVCPENGRGQGETAAPLQAGIAYSPAALNRPPQAMEMTGYGKRRKTKTRFPSAFHSPWKSLRDFHIPTASTTVSLYILNLKNRTRSCGPWKSGNPKAGFPLFHRPDSLRRKESAYQYERRNITPSGVAARQLSGSFLN
ncbi:MAG: hypothetical protein ACRD96_21645, partial [Bryobacteraceae bacterium]